jgi:hypothetical protein
MQMTGHKTRSVFEPYNSVSECDLVDAAKKLNAIQPVRLKPDTTTDNFPADSDRHGRQFGRSDTPIDIPPICEPLIS